MTQDEIRALFDYEPDTGMLRRREGAGRVPYPWRGIGKNKRYLAATLGGKNLYLHRAVWLWHHGWLPDQIDHADGNAQNNRIENLRPCSNAQNQYNGPIKSHNRSGFKGVVYRTGYRKPWQARIVVDGRALLIGRYDTAEEAHAAYIAAAIKHAGEFARAA
jgi:hypothetical protein